MVAFSALIAAEIIFSASPTHIATGTKEWCQQLEKAGVLGALFPIEEAAPELARHDVLGRLFAGTDLASPGGKREPTGTIATAAVVGDKRIAEIVVPFALGALLDGEIRINPTFTADGLWCAYVETRTTTEGAVDTTVKLPPTEVTIRAKLAGAVFAERKLDATVLRFFHDISPGLGDSLIASAANDGVFLAFTPAWQADQRDSLCGYIFDLFGRVPNELACPPDTITPNRARARKRIER